ncbi:phage tail tape measure protein [Cryobacterium cryoconiti]|uniref:Phage tail tape measure protein n=1 Tax=Cryobacterium cryoconiti TaxID=1259239 RepID=A0A4Y8JSN4_9MICO|nr:phage tail tape measure protein [Cryobacterium cryoconiti]TFD27526.1 phage tail tape measure protein [Cryobacterium cryoconiti]
MTDRTVKVSLTAQVTGYLQGMEKARKATADAGTAAEQAARQVEQQKQAMESAGRGLMVVGAVAVAATALSVKAAIGWQSAWAGVTKTVDGTPAELAKVEEGLRSLAKVLPATHEEIAGVAEAAGQLGVAREDVVGFTKTMVDLSETTNLSADEAATSIAQISNVMGTMRREGAEGVERFGSALVALGNAGASTEAEILEMAKRIAGAAKLVGASESDVLALANAMASVGIEAQLGGGVMSRVMQRMYADVMEGGEGLDNLAKVAGVSSKEFATAFETDPVRAVDMMVKGLGRVKDEGGNVIDTMDDLGVKGTEETGVILRLAGAGDLLTDSLKLGDSAWESNSALAEEAAKRYATVESQLQVASNRVTDAAISFGQVFLPAVSAAAEAVGGFANLLGGMDPVLQGTVATVALMGGAVALAGGGFLLAVPKIAAYQSALVVLSTSSMPGVAAAAAGLTSASAKSGAALAATAKFMTGPWGLALAAAAVGVKLMVDYFDSLKATSAEVTNSLTTASDAAQIFATIGEGREWTAWQDVTAQLEDLPAVLQASAEQSGNLWARFDQTHFGAFGALKDLGTELGSLASEDLPSAQAAFRLLSAETDESEQSQWRLLNSMPGYKQALVDQAKELGINVTSTDEAANKTALLELAFGSAAPVAITASEAYLAAADEASALAGEVLTLMEAINEANGIGQDAVSSNAAFQASMAGISDEVERQKDEFIKLQEEGYEEANGTLEGFVGTLDGFTLSLDESTASGSANAAMLSGVAADAQAAALAQFEVDKTTMSAKDATDKYITTLGLSREELQKQAEANGYSAEEVQKLLDKVFAMPTERETKLLVNTALATEQLSLFKAKWDGVKITGSLFMEASNGDRSMAAAAARYTGQAQAYFANPLNKATGGTIHGPGTATSDSIPVMLSNGEEVTRTAMADKYRPLLKAINADKVDQYRGIPGLATGGTAGYAAPVQYVPSYGGGGGGGGGQSSVTISPTVSLAGATLVMSVDGRQMTAVIQEQIVSASNASASQIRRGKQ